MGDQNEDFDLSVLRGTSATFENKVMGRNEDDDLNALAELVPDLKNRKKEPTTSMLMDEQPSSGEGIETPEMVKPPDLSPETENAVDPKNKDSFVREDDSSSDDINDVLYAGDDVYMEENHSSGEDGNDKHLGRDPPPTSAANPSNANDALGLGDFNNISSGQSLSTATQTQEVRMPMYLPTFKPATGCTNASDFIVRCFVARLRSGITVVKHGRSRWCKSRLRVLHIHPDGRSLSWKPAPGEPHSPKRPPKLDLTTCEEVRHAWSPDPQNPMYTGTPILRQKCEAANAHKSFALIFPKRTVDITSVTADQCKVLMEGFSALCFRLQVANLAGKGSKKGMPEAEQDDRISITASTTPSNRRGQ